MRYHVTIDEQGRWVERTAAGVRLDEREVSVELHRLEGDEASLRIDGSLHRIFGRRIDGGWRIQLRGRTFDVTVEDERAHAIRELAGDPAAGGGTLELRAPMPGLVVRVLVEVGQSVERGDPLVVVEAMKMENELRAEGAGVVARIHAVPGEAVDRDDVLVAFEADE